VLIVDAHEDLAYNMLTYGRDYTRAAAETRELEAGTIQIRAKEDTLLGWSDYRRGRVALIFATLFATPARLRSGDWDHLYYATVAEANRLYRNQLDLYHRLVDDHPEAFRLVESQKDMDEVLAGWEAVPSGKNEDNPNSPVGLVVSMEGAEGVRGPAELEDWWAGGVRWIGLAWAGNQYCGGTHEPGGLSHQGFELLEGMSSLGFGLDISHMDEAAALQALDIYSGTVIASHSNARALLRGMEGNRHLNDEVIRALLERDGVIGILPYNGFLQPGWKQGDQRETLSLRHVVAQIDYICQMAGDARHVGIGSDFDGGFGRQSVPPEIDTIADLQKLAPLLSERGYSDDDIRAIFAGNWTDRLRRILPG
jgi:membrane dipeptidase